MQYKLEIKPELRDYKEAALRGNLQFPFIILLVSSMTALLVVWLFLDSFSYPLQIIAFLLIMLLAIPLVWSYLIGNIKRAIGKNPEAWGAYRLHIDENGIRVEQENGFAGFSWNEIKQLKETPELLILKPYKSGGIIIPKRCLSQREEGMHIFIENMLAKNKESELGH